MMMMMEISSDAGSFVIELGDNTRSSRCYHIEACVVGTAVAYERHHEDVQLGQHCKPKACVLTSLLWTVLLGLVEVIPTARQRHLMSYAGTTR